MRIAKWGNSLAIRLPKDVAKELGISEGDDLHMEVGADGSILVSRAEDRATIIARIRKKAARPLPPDWKFDRDEVNQW